MDLHVTFTSRRDLVGQLHRQIRAAILDGRLTPGEQLPATRDLAARLGISRYTVAVAYDRLVADGFVQGRAGAGSFVTEQPTYPTEPARPSMALRPNPMWEAVGDVDWLQLTPRYDFRAGLPDARLFPYQTWRRLMADQIRTSVVGRANPGLPAGEIRLRTAIARHVGVSRGVTANADDVIVTTGCQQAVDLIVRVLLRPGDQVAVEAPGYPPIRLLLQMHNLRVAGVRVDSEGIVVDEIPPETKLVYVTPSHQFPLGMSMTAVRRLALLAWAGEHGAAVVEDDYDSEFRYGAGTVDPLQCLDRTGRVIYVATFSKTLLPTLRVGFMIAPPSLHDALRRAKFVADWHTTLPTQLALAEFIETGLFARHIRAMRREYLARHQLIIDILNRDFAALLSPIDGAVGLHVSALTKQHTLAEVDAFVARAPDRDLGVYPLGSFGHDGHRPAGITLGYGAIAVQDIEDGLAILLDLMS